MSAIKLENNGDLIDVFTPYSSSFVSKIKRNCGGAKWNPEKKCWSVSADQKTALLRVLNDVFGYSEQTAGKTIDLRITFLEDNNALKDAISFPGYKIAAATGRDSGAKLCEGVELVEGGFSSGGSRNNWETTVRKGTVVICRKVPEGLPDKGLNLWWDGKNAYTIEILDSKIDREALEAEKEQLLKRLAEIESLLKDESMSTATTPEQP